MTLFTSDRTRQNQVIVVGQACYDRVAGCRNRADRFGLVVRKSLSEGIIDPLAL